MLQPTTVNTGSNLQSNHVFGLNDTLMFNTRLSGGTTTQSFVSALMGNKERPLQFIKGIFSNQEHASLSIVDHAADTPFRCLLIALFIEQLGKFLDVQFNYVRLFLTPVHESNGMDSQFKMADSLFGSTDIRNDFTKEAVSKITGMDCKLHCKRNHFRREDIKLVTEDYTLHIRPLRPEGGLSCGWLTKRGGYPFMSASEFLVHHNDDIPCYNEYTTRNDKNAMLINIELVPNNPSIFLV